MLPPDIKVKVERVFLSTLFEIISRKIMETF